MGNTVATNNRTSTGLSEKEIAMLKSSTNNSEEQIQKWHSNFQKTCPTGRINKKTFIQLYKALNKNINEDALCEHIFAVFDINHDGTIDFNELLLAIAATSKTGLDNELEFVFEMCDISGDGCIDLNELTKWFSTGFELNGEISPKKDLDAKIIAIAIFDKFGVDKEKKITKQQFIDGCKQNPSLRKIFKNDK